jgi:hypothetical protein
MYLVQKKFASPHTALKFNRERIGNETTSSFLQTAHKVSHKHDADDDRLRLMVVLAVGLGRFFEKIEFSFHASPFLEVGPL